MEIKIPKKIEKELEENEDADEDAVCKWNYFYKSQHNLQYDECIKELESNLAW